MGVVLQGLQAGLLNQSSAQVIDGSLKFDSSSSNYLNRTPSSASNRKTWTWSGWVKKTGVGTQSFIFSCMPSGSYFQSYFSADKLYLQANTPTFYVETTQVFRDLGWYHIVIVLDTPQTDPTDRLKLYVNGEEASFGTDQRSSLTQDSDLRINDTQSHSIGSQQPLQGVYANFNLSQIYFIDGQALGCGYFGFTDPLTNTWRPKKVRQGDPTANDGRTWSDSSNLTNITNGAGAFDGDLTGGNYAYATGAGNSGTINFSNLTSVSTLRLYAREDSREASGKITVNSTDFDFPTTAAWVDVSSALSGGLSSITLKNGSYLTALFAIEVDGVVLRNGITTNLDFGTNGFYLPMDNDDFHIDKSGKGNNWTKQNFSGTFNDPDVLKDSPSGAVSGGRAQTGITTTSSAPSNYATLNPLSLTNTLSLSDGNLDYTATSAANNECFSNIRLNGGKFYFESNLINAADVPGSTSFRFGICKNLSGSNIIIYNATGNFETLGTTDSSPPSYTAGNIIGVAVDCVNGSIQFFKDGVSVGTKTFTVGTDEWTSYIRIYKGGGNTVNGTINFGQKPFKYAPPQGYLPLNSASATPETVITRPDQYMNTVTYTGTGSDLILDVGFKPDLSYFSIRSATGYIKYMFDSVRGATKLLATSHTQTDDAEGTSSNTLKSFNANGVTIGNNAQMNENSSNTWVSWHWKAGGNKNTFNVDDIGYASAAAAGLTGGTITPTGSSVGTKQGFSIIGFTDGGSACSIPHGLTKAPDFYIVKFRGASGNWSIYHKSLGNTKRLKFTSDNSGSADAGWWQNTSPTSSLFYLGGNLITSTTQIAYLWHDVPGLQKFGSYTGVNSTNGPFLELGFRPAIIMFKNISSGSTGWVILDNKRNGFNGTGGNNILFPNTNDAENTTQYGDFLSNGWKFRINSSYVNSTDTFIYAAWAESPVSNLYGGQSNAR